MLKKRSPYFYPITLSIFICFLSIFNGVIPLQYDNLFYMNGARNIFEQGAYVNGVNLVEPQWPILYSLTLVPSFFLGIPVEVFARILNFLYFFGGIFFFFQFLKLNKVSEKTTFSVTAFCLLNYYLYRSVFLEMPDIALFFYFNFFVYLCANLNNKPVQSACWIGIVSLLSTMTKPTGAVFAISCLLSFVGGLVFNRRFDKGYFIACISSVVGLVAAKVINKKVILNLTSLGYEVNTYWQKVDGGVSNLILILQDQLKIFTDFSIFYQKIIFFSNWLIPSGVFAKISIIPFFLGLLLLLIIIYQIWILAFKAKKKFSLPIVAFIIYAGLCISPEIQNRHTILIFPFLFFLVVTFFEKNDFFNKFDKYKKHLLIFILIFNLIPTFIFLGFGNKKNHSGLLNIVLGKSYYLSHFDNLKKSAKKLSEYQSNNFFVHENFVRFVSFHSKRQVKPSKTDTNYESGDIVLLPKADVLKMTKLTTIIYSNPDYQIFKIK